MSKVALIVIFNHRFERNVPRLEDYYAPRFAIRKYLIPFADLGQPNVIRVVENGWTFSGHIAQGQASYNDPDVTHYLFVGDDLILNPSLNEANLPNLLNLVPEEGYIKNLVPADTIRFQWPHSIISTRAIQNPGFDHKSELPPAAEAQKQFEAMGLEFRSPWPRSKYDWRHMLLTFPRHLRRHWWMNLTQMGKPALYPLLSGYSDFVVVPSGSLQRFSHYCAVFAAMNIFAEIAVPTALALACPLVKTELAYGEHFFRTAAKRAPGSTMRGLEFWYGDIPRFCNKYGYSWSRLLAEFPSDCLYYHPIKLSQWK